MQYDGIYNFLFIFWQFWFRLVKGDVGWNLMNVELGEVYIWGFFDLYNREWGI